LVAITTVSCLPGCSPSHRTTSDADDRALLTFDQVRELAGGMLERIHPDAERIAGFGPRQTGQVGCRKTYEYVKAVFGALDGPRRSLREFGSTVTVPLDRFAAEEAVAGREHSSVTLHVPGRPPQTWDAFSCYPNNVQDCLTTPASETPRRLVDLGFGAAADFAGKDVADAVVLLDYNSAEAWLRARELGAYAAVFVEPSWTNWRQSDLKYLDMIPIHMPRLWIDRQAAQSMRDALAAGGDVQVTVRSRLAWRNVRAPCVEFTIPGKDRSRTFILASHFDARSMVPDLAYGGDEVWGIAALLELARHYAVNPPPVNLRFIAVSGHWQAQRCTRDYIAHGAVGFEEVGNPVRLVMGLDFSTEGASLNLTRETAWDDGSQTNYRWLKTALFNKGGWYDQIREGLDLARRNIDLYADERSFMVYTTDGDMAPRDRLCPLTYSPRFYTANEAWASVNAPTFAFQTSELWRLHHNSPLDSFAVSAAPERLANLRPQLEMTLAVLDRLATRCSGGAPPTASTCSCAAAFRRGTQPRDGSARSCRPRGTSRREMNRRSDRWRDDRAVRPPDPCGRSCTPRAWTPASTAAPSAGSGPTWRGLWRRIASSTASCNLSCSGRSGCWMSRPSRSTPSTPRRPAPRWTCWPTGWTSQAGSCTRPITASTATATRRSGAPT